MKVAPNSRYWQAHNQHTCCAQAPNAGTNAPTGLVAIGVVGAENRMVLSRVVYRKQNIGPFEGLAADRLSHIFDEKKSL